MRRMVDNTFYEFDENGNLILGKNLYTDGYIKSGAYEFDEDLEFTSSVSGITFGYCHARVSNGKLNIVISLISDGETAVATDANITTSGDFTIPEEVGAQLYEITGDVIARDLKPFVFASSTALASSEVFCSLNKNSDTELRLLIKYKGSSDLTQGSSNAGIVRFEFNFLLS